MAGQGTSCNHRRTHQQNVSTCSITQNSGAFYFCGRDQQYRPIIVADIGKFTSDDVDIIPKTLVIIMDFMISNLLIEGQVENYILIMNL